MSGTTNLCIPFIQAAQNQNEVTANAAFEALAGQHRGDAEPRRL